MKRYLNPLYSLLVLLGLTFSLASCADDSPTDPGGDVPVISSFTATPGTVDIGSSTTLAWSVSDANTISIDNGIGVQTGTSVVVFPAANTTYTLTATNDEGSTTKTVSVVVNNPADPGAPPNPTGLTATAGNAGIIALNWTASAGASSYLVERRSAVGGFSLVSTANVNSYSDVGLFPGVVYTYRVRAVSSAGARSGWSNFASATAPGTAPVVDRVELTPNNPATLQPGGTVQLTARALDASGNDLGFAPGIFTWTSSNVAIAPVSQTGLVSIPSTATQGSAQITASVGGVTSNASTITVALQKATTLVIYHPRYEGDNDWSVYTSAFTGHTVDVLYDAADITPTIISLDQLEGYERVFYFTHEDNPLHASTRQLLRLYAQMPNKRLILMGNSNVLSDDNAFLALLGVDDETWHASNQVNSTFTGGAGTAMEGFTFDFSADWDYISELTLSPTTPGLAALTATSLTSETWVVAVQNTLTSGSKVYYGGFVLENVQTNLRDDYITRLMNF